MYGRKDNFTGFLREFICHYETSAIESTLARRVKIVSPALWNLIMPVLFTQSCPTCGRRVQVRASLVGYTVVCQHCSAEFKARTDDFGVSHSAATQDVETDPLMVRVEEALKRAAAEPQSPMV